MGFFGRGSQKNAASGQQQQTAAAIQAAEQQYGPIVRDCLARLQVWAYPYCQIDGWEIWHADAQGQRIVDVRVQLILGAKPSFTVKALAWQDSDLDAGSEYSDVELTAVDLYDALRRAVTQEA